MNPLIKIMQQGKKVETVTILAVIEKVEKIRQLQLKDKQDIQRVAQMLLTLKKEVQDIPLSDEVRKLQKAITEAENRISEALVAQLDGVQKDLRNTERKLRQEIADKIPDVVTVTERVNEIEKALTNKDYEKVISKVKEDESVAKAVRDFFEGFEGDERLDASAIKNLPATTGFSTGGGSNLSVSQNGSFVSSSTRLNIQTNNAAPNGVSSSAGTTKLKVPSIIVSATEPSNPSLNDIWIRI
jgi:dGTP triphosphohydrolase